MYAGLDLKVSIKNRCEGCNVMSNKQIECDWGGDKKSKVEPRQLADLGTAGSGLNTDRLVG
jgi:hypothetical protein